MAYQMAATVVILNDLYSRLEIACPLCSIFARI